MASPRPTSGPPRIRSRLGGVGGWGLGFGFGSRRREMGFGSRRREMGFGSRRREMARMTRTRRREGAKARRREGADDAKARRREGADDAKARRREGAKWVGMRWSAVYCAVLRCASYMLHYLNIICAARICYAVWCNSCETYCFKDEILLIMLAAPKPLTPAGTVCYHTYVHPHAANLQRTPRTRTVARAHPDMWCDHIKSVTIISTARCH